LKACTSAFSLLELIDKEQEYTLVWHMLRDGYSFDEILRKRSDRNLSEKELLEAFDKVDRVFTVQYKKHIDLYYLDNEGWDKAIELMQTLNLTARDAIHLATALMAGCDLLVSNDQNFLKNAEKVIRVSTPDEVNNNILQVLRGKSKSQNYRK
jgi:predicted nucleic acid-binding protein